ncbi:MAG TPA: BMP family ABC transporter substrate-binding protein, partial [Anaerolineaceae bacterium]|nr:BMP family ABC transporter substrate-binding protein [Anaerolineaceae bacterium]
VEYLVKQISAGAYTAMDLKDFSMVAKGGASIAPLTDAMKAKLPADLIAKVEQKAADIKSGAFRVNIDEAVPQQ